MQRKQNAEITSQSGIRLGESKTHVAQCATSDTVCERRLFPVKNHVNKL